MELADAKRLKELEKENGELKKMLAESMRRACTYLNLPRSTYRYVPKRLTDRQEQLYQRVIALFWHHPRYGYRRIRALLVREGWQVKS